MNELLKKLRSQMKRFDELEKEAQKYFSNGYMTRLQFKMVKDMINKMRVDNQILILELNNGDK